MPRLPGRNFGGMEHVSLAGLEVSRLGLGCMGMSAVLRAGQLERLTALAPPAGDRYADMTPLGR